MDSAVGSGCEPEYGGMDGGSESPQGQGLSGFPERGGLFAGDRDTGDDEPVTRGAEAGDRTPEQQAADILLQATEGLEPDYEFESVGDGRDEQSPERENSAQRAPLPLNQGRARGPTRLADEASVNGVMPGVQGQRVAAESGSRSGRGLDLGSNVPLQGMSRGTLDHQSGQQGHIPAGERRQRSGRGSDVEPGFPMQALFREQLEQQTSQHERVELLERLVCQLMDQNELLRREAVDVASRSSAESGLSSRDLQRGFVESGRSIARVEQPSVRAGQEVAAVEGYVQTWNSSLSRPSEGRGCGALGNKAKLGKGIGVQGGRDLDAGHSRVFRPPWTSFQSSSEDTMPAAMPSTGPGDKLLQATRAFQDLSLGPQVEGSRSMHPSWFQLDAALQDTQPMEVGDSASLQEVSRSAGNINRGLGKGQDRVGFSHDPLKHQDPEPSSVQQIQSCAGPSRVEQLPACQRGIEGEMVGKKVQVWINGVMREGVYDSQGSVVLVPEAPKYFALEEEPVPAPPPNPSPESPNPKVYQSSGDPGKLKDGSGPWSSKAASPFRAVDGSPPPPPPVYRGSAAGSRSGASRSPQPRRSPSRAANKSPDTGHVTSYRFARKLQASPATPGGTRIPKGDPPPSPPPLGVPDSAQHQSINLSSLSVHGDSRDDNMQSKSQAKDFLPGERTLWELPKLGPVTEACPALRCNDWLHKIKSSMMDLAPKAHEWWKCVTDEAKAAYDAWCQASPLQRARITGKPSARLLGDVFIRLEARGLAMLIKALPDTIYNMALSQRNTTCTGLLFITMKTYQPGGLVERGELLKGLTNLDVSNDAVAAVANLQRWSRHLDRAKSMGISVPDSSLLLQGIDKSVQALLQSHTALSFRMHTARMQLQLDTVPSHDRVEEYVTALLAEFELLAVAMPDTSAKRPRVAALDKGKGGAKSDSQKPSEPKGTPEKPDPKAKPKNPCRGWITDAGCHYGKNCSFAHTAERPGKCWTCGGAHAKADCTAPGGGSAPKSQPLEGGKGKGVQQGSLGPKGGGKTSSGSGKPSSTKGQTASQKGNGLSDEAIKEAAQLLQSLRLASLSVHVDPLVRVLCKVQKDERKGLLDGGATTCLRAARESEFHLPEIKVKLAYGQCSLLVNRAGILLSREYVAPIVSVKAILSLGYKMEWNNSRCRVWHPTEGELPVDVQTGCPEIPEECALALIDRYEQLVLKSEGLKARMCCLMRDMTGLSVKELAHLVVRRDAQGDAALKMLVESVFKDTPTDLVDQVVASVQDQVSETFTWNRRMRRRFERSEGLVLHLFCGEGRRAFDKVAEKNGMVHVPVETGEDLLADETYQFLLRQAARGRIKALICSPPSRTFAPCRYAVNQGDGVIRPIRVRGESLGEYGVDGLNGQELAQHRVDDVLLMRMLVLMIVAHVSNEALSKTSLVCAVEHPEDPEEGGVLGVKLSDQVKPEEGYASLWVTPEWKAVCGILELTEVSFHQGPLGHAKARPTTLCTNMYPDSLLVDCWDEGYLTRPRGPGQAQTWSQWAPGLWLAVSNMLGRSLKENAGDSHSTLRSIDAGFIEHLKNNHTPFRRDCRACLSGAARQRQHRKILTPQSWTLSVDTAGPFPAGTDEGCGKRPKYLIVGVLSIPLLSTKGPEVTEPADRDPGVDVKMFADHLADEEWFMEQGCEPSEVEPEVSAKDAADAKKAWESWADRVKGSQKDWLQEAQALHLPKVTVVDYVLTEPVPSKKQQEVTNAISRMYARIVSDGFSVQRLHSDRGREYNNETLKTWCAKFGIHKTLAFAEEHQSNGRAEAAIMRVKGKTRSILQGSGSDLADWPLAAKLAAHELRESTRRVLKMKPFPTVPYNTEVQVLQRSWHRGVWESLTAKAYTKCPSSDCSRGWVVRTEDGRLFTTSKLFPAVDGTYVKFEHVGQPVDLDAPAVRVREKTKMKRLESTGVIRDPSHPADALAKKLYEAEHWEPRHIASLAVCMARTMPMNSRKLQEGSGGEGESLRCNFLSGGFTYSGMSGVRSDTTDHEWLTKYLCAYLARHTDVPFAGVGLALNVHHSMHRDVHNQRGVPNVVLPIVSSGGGLWLQKRPEDNGEIVVRKDDKGKEVAGCVHVYNSHEPFVFEPQGWHASVVAAGPQLLLFGYTARGLHKLKKPDRKRLWDLGFTYVPATKTEYWGYKTSVGTLVRYHPVPRRQLFVPTDSDMLPFPKSCLGDLRLCEQQVQDQEPVHTWHCWRKGRGRAPATKWTGWSAFSLHLGAPTCARSGGGDTDAGTDANSGEKPNAKPKIDYRGCSPCSVQSVGVGKYVAGTGGVESFAEVPGVVEVPHQCERLFMQQCGKTRAREYSGVDAISDPSVPRLCSLGGSIQVEPSTPGNCNRGTLQVGESDGRVDLSSPQLRCEDLVTGCAKGIELLGATRGKVTVREEFPARCPREVMYKCLGIELCRLARSLEQIQQVESQDVPCDEVLLPYEVPLVSKRLCRCGPVEAADDNCCVLERTHWPVTGMVREVSEELALEHQCRCRVLEALSDDLEGVLKECELGLVEDIKGLERELEELRKAEVQELRKLEHVAVQSFPGLSLSSLQLPGASADAVESEDEEGASAPSSGGVVQSSCERSEDDPAPLQTKIIAAEQVRRELPHWIPPMTEEYESLVSKTAAVDELDNGAYQALIADPNITVEQIPGKLVYVRKPTGRRKARIVGCGNFCGSSGVGDRSELYASGAGAETLRLMLRRCALESSWVLSSVDVRTAFLNAPLMEMTREGKQLVTVVRVPSILREAGITKCKFWRVCKALYGLASAPKSWACHRDKVIGELRIPYGDSILTLRKVPEDANLLHICKMPSEWRLKEGVDASSECGVKVGVVALYVDDILIGAERDVVEGVIKALQSKWELSPPEWVSGVGDCMKFAGYELERTSEGIRVHQESYVRDLLDQYDEEIPGTERAPAIKMSGSCEALGDDEKRRLIKRAQTLTGQLLWVANRTRPDISYAVSMASQRIVHDPAEAVARAEQIIKYLRGTPGIGLHYKPAQGRCGKWDQLKFQETAESIDAFADASFAADEQSRSYGCIQLYWGGALVAWASNRQTLIASHTAECELYSLAEAHLLGKAMRPTVAALMDVHEKDIEARLYCDNAAAIQLCVLESGSWRTRHLRLRGAVIRSDLEEGLWVLAHLEGVFMPADIGTKPVGPSRLEDLIKVCDLWAPQVTSSATPPRTQVATMHSKPGEVSKALLALLVLIQVSGVDAVTWQLRVEDSGDFLQSVLCGFGIGCGFWLATRIGGLIDRCFRPRPVSGGLKKSVLVPTRVDSGVQTDEQGLFSALETGEHRGSTTQLERSGSQLRDWEPRRLEDEGFQQDYEQHVEMECARSSFDAGRVPQTLPGPVDPRGSPEVQFVNRIEYRDAARAHAMVQEVELYYTQQLAETGVRVPVGEVLEVDRTPAVPRFPIVPLHHVPTDRVVYEDDEADAPSEAEESLSSMGEWSTDSGMPRGRGSGSSGSHVSARSLAAVSLVASVHSARAWRDSEEGTDGSWELWFLLGLVALGCGLVGAVCAVGCLWCCTNRQQSGSMRSTGSLQYSGEATPSENVGTPRPGKGKGVGSDSRFGSVPSGCGLQIPPVVNVTINADIGSTERNKSEVVEVVEDSSEGLSAAGLRIRRPPPDSSKGLGPNRTWEPAQATAADSESRVGPCGLGPRRTGEPAQAAAETSESRVGPFGLGACRTCEPAQAAAATSESRVGPFGLEPARTREATRPVVATAAPQVGPCGLELPSDPRRLGVNEQGLSRSSGSSGDGPRATEQSGARTEDPNRALPFGCGDESVEYPTQASSTVCVDRVRRPFGVKKMQIFSCDEAELGVNVIVTQNGDCFHRSLQCPAASKSSDIRRRQTCYVCRLHEGFPSQDVVYFNRMAKRVHISKDCAALDPNQEVIARRRCKFCGSQ